MELDEDVLATLTDEEREAIESGDLSERDGCPQGHRPADDEDDGDNTDNAPPSKARALQTMLPVRRR